MRVDLVQVAEELVEPVLPRNPRSADVSQSPLPESTCRVARRLQDLCHGDVAGQNRHSTGIRSDRDVSRVEACHENVAGWGADRAA